MGPASALRALALLGCCAQLARAGAGYHVGKIRNYGDPDYYTQLKDIDPSHGQLKQADDPTKGFHPDVTEYTVRIDDESITEVVFTLVLDFTYYNLMYTPELTFYNGTGEGGDILAYSPLDVIHLKVPLDVDSENKTFIGPYDKTAWVKLTDPESKGGIGGFGEKSTKYNIRVLQPPLYKDACQAERIVVRNSTRGKRGVKDSHPPFEKGSPNHRYEYIFQDKEGHVKFECPNVEDVVAKIDGEGEGSNIATLRLNLDKDVRWNLVATCEYHDTKRTADFRFPSQIRSYDLVIEKRTNVNELEQMVKEVMLTAQLGYCEQVDKSELADGGEWEDLRAIYEGECCDWDDVECKACEDDETMEEYCKKDPTTHGCHLIMAVTSAAPATMASTTMAPAQDSGVCGNVDVKDCKAREEAGQTEHQFCMFHKETRGCERFNHHARRLDVVPRDFGYLCRVKDLADGEQIELVVLFEEGSPDAFLQGNMITDPGQHKPTPQKLRVMNGVPISFETKTQRSKFMLNIQAGEHLIKVPIEIKVPAMCPGKDFCRDGLVYRESSCDAQVCPQEYMCKGDPCKLEDDHETCCAKPATCQTFKTKNMKCTNKIFGSTSFKRMPRPGDDIKDRMCKSNICKSGSDSDACCQSRDDKKNGTVATHLHPTDKVFLPGCLDCAKRGAVIVGRCEGKEGGWKVDVTGCGCPGKESSQCWTPSVGDVVKMGDQMAVISESENPYAEDPDNNITVNMAPSKDDVYDGSWIWVFKPGDTVVVPQHGNVHEQDGTLRTSLDFETGKWLINVVDRGSDGYQAAIKPGWSFFAFGDTYHGKVVSGPAADGSFLVNFTENKGFEPGEDIVTKGARAKVKDGFQGTGGTGMYTVRFPNDNNGKYTVISYPIPSYDIHAYHDVTTNKTNGKTNKSTDGRYKPGDEVNVVSKGPGIVVFGPDNGQYLVTILSKAETLGVTEGNITGLVHEGHIDFMQKDRAEGLVVGAMRLGSAWGLPLALAAVGGVTAMTLVVLRRRSLRSLRETSRNIQKRVNQRDQDRLLPVAADMESA